MFVDNYLFVVPDIKDLVTVMQRVGYQRLVVFPAGFKRSHRDFMKKLS